MVVEVEDLDLIEDGLSFPHGLGEMKVELQGVGGKGLGCRVNLPHNGRLTGRKYRYAVGGSDFRAIGSLQHGPVAESSAQTVLWGEYRTFSSLPDFSENEWSLAAFLVEQGQAEATFLGPSYHFDPGGIIRQWTDFEAGRRLFLR
jgi:hypothetical protein